MRVAIQQPNYAPWCGYFAKMRHCDVFVFLDDVQMPNRGYVSRTRIRGPNGGSWLSLPVSFTTGDRITDVRFADRRWIDKHLARIRQTYARCSHVTEVLALIEPAYRGQAASMAEFNRRLITVIADYLGIACRFERSSELEPAGAGDQRLLSIVQRVGGTCYVSGAGGAKYQRPELFRDAGVRLDVKRYRPVPYRQLQGEFVEGLSILDTLCHLGRRALDLLHYEGHGARV